MQGRGLNKLLTSIMYASMLALKWVGEGKNNDNLQNKAVDTSVTKCFIANKEVRSSGAGDTHPSKGKETYQC